MATSYTSPISYVEQDEPRLKRTCIDVLERASGRRVIEQIYLQTRAAAPEITNFFSEAVRQGGLNLRFDPRQTAKIPTDGPLIFIANHPFGVVDGLVMCDLAERSRGDFKVLLHSHLCRDETLKPCFLPVSFDETREAVRSNVETKRAALSHLADGGSLVIFPAGGVSTRGKFGFGPLEDLPWSTFVAKLARTSKATVVPVYFYGQNGFLFHFVSAFSLTLRTSLLLAEARKKVGQEIAFKIGDPIPFSEYGEIESRQRLTDFLKSRTFQLANAGTAG